MVRGGNSFSPPPRTNELTYRPLALRRAQWRQSGLPPVPERRYLRSMLLPSVQEVLLWYLGCLTECHVRLVRGMVSPFCGAECAAPHWNLATFGTAKLDGGALIQYNTR
jgi:hypothetical protein